MSLSGECSAFKERFMECLRQSGYESGACRQRAMAYLECRMERQVGALARPGGGEGRAVRGSRVAPGVGKQRGCLCGEGKGREPAAEAFVRGARVLVRSGCPLRLQQFPWLMFLMGCRYPARRVG